METIFIAGLTIYIITREIMFFIERRDMLDRLMSRNLVEYKDNAKPEANEFNIEDPTVSLEQAREEIDG